MKKIISMVLVLTMLLTMVSTVTFADAEFTLAVDSTAVVEEVETEEEVEFELADAGDFLAWDDFTDNATLEPVAQNGWDPKGGRVTPLYEVPACLEATVADAYLDYSDENFGGNTVGVLVSFDDNWMTGRLNKTYQIPDLWGAWDYACKYSGVTFYAGTSADDLEEVTIEKAAFIRPGQGQPISAELLAQIPEGATYFKVAFTNAAWELKLCWVNVYEGSVADVESVYTAPTYHVYPADLEFATITPSPTPKPIATPDEDGVIIYDTFADLEMAYSYKNYIVKEGTQTVNGTSYENYLESEGWGNYTEPSEIVYRGKFGKSTVSFTATFNDWLINGVLPEVYPDVQDMWGAYETVMDYAEYRVYAGPSVNMMTEITANPENVEYLFERPAEGENFGVVVNVTGIPSNSEFIKISLNMPSGTWMATLADVFITGPGILDDSDIVGNGVYDTCATTDKISSSVGSLTQGTGEYTTAFGSFAGYWEGSGNSDVREEVAVTYEGEFGNMRTGFCYFINDWYISESIGAKFPDQLAAVPNRWTAYDLLYQTYREDVKIYAGPDAENLTEMPITHLIGPSTSGQGYQLAVEVVTGVMPEDTKVVKVSFNNSNWKEKWSFIEIKEEIVPISSQVEMVEVPEPLATATPAPTATPEPTPVPDLEALFDDFSALTDVEVETGTSISEFIETEAEGDYSWTNFVEASYAYYRKWIASDHLTVDKNIGIDQNQYIEGYPDTGAGIDTYFVYAGDFTGKTLEFETALSGSKEYGLVQYIEAYRPIIQVKTEGGEWTDVDATHYLYNDYIKYMGWDGCGDMICKFIVDELPEADYVKVGFTGDYRNRILSVSIDGSSNVLDDPNVYSADELPTVLTKFADNFSTLRKPSADADDSIYMSSPADVAKAKFSSVSNLCYYAAKGSSVATNFNAAGGYVEGSWGSACTASIGYTGEFDGLAAQIVLTAGDDQYKTAFYGVYGEDATLQWGDYSVLWDYYFADKLHVYAGTSKDDLKEVAVSGYSGQGMQGATVLAVNSDVFPEDTTYFEFVIEDIFYWPYKLLEVQCDELSVLEAEGKFTPVEPPVESDVVYGDVNADGVINVNDAVLLTEYVGVMAAGGTLDAEKFPNGTFPGGLDSAKLTADDDINVNDVVLLTEYIGTIAAGGTLDAEKFPGGNFPGAAN